MFSTNIAPTVPEGTSHPVSTGNSDSLDTIQIPPIPYRGYAVNDAEWFNIVNAWFRLLIEVYLRCHNYDTIHRQDVSCVVNSISDIQMMSGPDEGVPTDEWFLQLVNWYHELCKWYKSRCQYEQLVKHIQSQQFSSGIYTISKLVLPDRTVIYCPTTKSEPRLSQILRFKRDLVKRGFDPQYTKLVSTGENQWRVFNTIEIDYILDDTLVSTDVFNPDGDLEPIEVMLFTSILNLHVNFFEDREEEYDTLHLYLTLMSIKNMNVDIPQLSEDEWKHRGSQIVYSIYKGLFPSYYQKKEREEREERQEREYINFVFLTELEEQRLEQHRQEQQQQIQQQEREQQQQQIQQLRFQLMRMQRQEM